MKTALKALVVTALCLVAVALMLWDWHLTGLAAGLVAGAIVIE